MRSLPPIRTPQEGLALIGAILYKDWLDPEVETIGSRHPLKWDWMHDGWRWLCNVPQGPHSREAVEVIQGAQESHGHKNVATGNAADPRTGEPGPFPREYAPNEIGVYIRSES